MSQDPQLFREEALRDYATSRVEGRLLQISPGWTKWMYWLLLLVTVSAIAFAALAKVDRWIAGDAVAREDGTVMAIFPESAREELRAGGELQLRFLDDRTATIQRVHERLFAPSRLRAEFGYASDFLRPEAPVLVVEIDATAPPGAHGPVELKSGQVRVLDLIFPGRSE